jgi:hypothetical protein
MSNILPESTKRELNKILSTVPGKGFGKVYTKVDHKLYFQDGAGIEHEIAFV